MGIADTLHDAVEDIQEYLNRSDEYAPLLPLRTKLEKLLADMNAMRADIDALDALPPDRPSKGSA
jgi:hypothetical protein